MHYLGQPHPVQNGPSKNANNTASENHLYGSDLNKSLLLFPVLVSGAGAWGSRWAPFAPELGVWVTVTMAHCMPPSLSTSSVPTWLPAQRGQKANAYCVINKALTSDPYAALSLVNCHLAYVQRKANSK